MFKYTPNSQSLHSIRTPHAAPGPHTPKNIEVSDEADGDDLDNNNNNNNNNKNIAEM